MPEKNTSIASRRPEERLARRQPALDLMQRFEDEIDRLFDDFGFGRSWLSPRLGRRSFLPSLFARGTERGRDLWSPAVDVFQRGNELMIRADLPGLRKEDITVDVTEDAVTIQGERRQESEEEREGVYRAERSYGSFYRVVPLPEGAITDQAKAHFHDGVLEISMPAPPEQATRGHRLEITQEAEQKK